MEVTFTNGCDFGPPKSCEMKDSMLVINCSKDAGVGTKDSMPVFDCNNLVVKEIMPVITEVANVLFYGAVHGVDGANRVFDEVTTCGKRLVFQESSHPEVKSSGYLNALTFSQDLDIEWSIVERAMKGSCASGCNQ